MRARVSWPLLTCGTDDIISKHIASCNQVLVAKRRSLLSGKTITAFCLVTNSRLFKLFAFRKSGCDRFLKKEQPLQITVQEGHHPVHF